jgi:hypothetical protein
MNTEYQNEISRIKYVVDGTYVQRMAVPAWARSFRKSITAHADCESRPVVGSSRNKRSLGWMKDRKKQEEKRIPKHALWQQAQRQSSFASGALHSVSLSRHLRRPQVHTSLNIAPRYPARVRSHLLTPMKDVVYSLCLLFSKRYLLWLP